MKRKRKRAPLTQRARKICAKVGYLFRASGEKQEAFAQRVGVKQPVLSQWINFRAVPSDESQEKIARAAGIPDRCLPCGDDDTVCKSCTTKRRPLPPPS